MRNHRLGTLTRWTTQFAPGVLICVLVLMSRPPGEWPVLVGAILMYFAVLIGFVFWIARDRRVDVALRAPSSIAFATQNVAGAVVHVEQFLVPDVQFARGPSFVIAADDSGLHYFTRGKNPVAFVRIPWAEIDTIAASGGDLIVTLADGNLLMHIPGGLLPMGARRVRALAASVSALQLERQL